MYKISVIVPVYNAEKYILRCLKTVTKQKLPDDFEDKIEIIVVDDGSIDNSENIIKAFIVKEANNKHYDIQYYYKKNGGVSSARNYGVARAKGEYIMFIDSDDYFEEDIFKTILPELKENLDLLKYKCQKVDNKGNTLAIVEGPTFNTINGEEAFNKLCYSDKLIDVIWLYCIRKEYFKSTNLKFAEGRYHEDFDIIPFIITKAKRVKSIASILYNYVQTETESIVRNNSNDKKLKRSYDLLFHYDEMIKRLKKEQYSKTTEENLKIYYTNCILLEVNNIDNEEEKNKYIKEIKNRKMVNNIKSRNVKQLMKKVLLKVSIKSYLKMRK